MKNVIIDSERLYIRKIDESDKNDVCSLYENITSCHLDRNQKEINEKYRNFLWAEINSKDTINYVIVEKTSGSFVGKICMQHINNEFPELGIDLLKVFQNIGYGPEAIKAFVNWYSKEYHVFQIKIRIEKNNLHSIHVFEKIGVNFKSESTYFPASLIKKIEKLLPDKNISAEYENTVNDYIMNIPI